MGGITARFLSWCSEGLGAKGKRASILARGNASWHKKSREVRRRIGEHNRRSVKKGHEEGVRILGRLLPKQSPWLDPIEPKRMHGKRRVAEADGPSSARELAERVCPAFDCPHHEHLSLPEKVA